MTFIEALGIGAMIAGLVVSIIAYIVADQANRRAARTRIELDLIRERLGVGERTLMPRWGDEWVDESFIQGERICQPIGPRQ